MNIFNSKKFKHGSVATILTIFFIVLIVAVNFVATALADRFPLKIDITDEGLYTLSEDTVQYLKNIDKEVEITVISSMGEVIQVDDYYQSMYYSYYGVDFNASLQKAGVALENFVAQSPNLSMKVVDIDTDPAFKSQFSKDHPSETLQDGQILIECGNKLQIVPYVDMVFIDTSSTNSQGLPRVALRTEKLMISAVMAVTEENVPKVAFTTGHNETVTERFESLLAENTFQVGSINIGTEEIEDDVTFIVINAPETDFTLEEIQKLDEFLNNDEQYQKNVVYFPSPTTGEKPMLESFLNDWGIATVSGVVLETDAKRVYDSYGYAYYLDYADEVYGEKYKNRTTKLVTAFAQPLKTLFTEKDARSTSVLLTASSTCVLLPLDLTAEEQSTWKPQNAEVKGPFDAGIIGTKRRYDDDNLALESHVTVFSSIYMISDSYLGASAYDNSNYILDVFAGLCDKEEYISVLTKEITSQMTTMTASTQNAYMIIFLICLPILTVIGGLVMWILRRNK